MVTTPNGEEFPVPCSTCSTGISEPTGTISIYEFRPAVTELTICLVRSEQTRDSHKVEYMATETGYPSGTIHNEAFLFKFPEEALHAADKLVALAAIKRDRENAERERAERKKRERKQKNTKR